YWMRKAAAADGSPDQLLYHWIFIETICAKPLEASGSWFKKSTGENEPVIEVIRQLLSKRRAQRLAYSYAWTISHSITLRTKFRSLEHGMSDDLIQRAEIGGGPGTQHLINFIQAAPEIVEAIPDGLLADQLNEMIRFYGDRTVASAVLRNNAENADDELQFVYRIRNKIAHNGSKLSPLLPFACEIARGYANDLMNLLIEEQSQSEGLPIDQILIRSVQRYDII
ncbi:hypothetical protein, partial [Agrobacterium tumefaciens]|uniref:hypothetical protein n=1 Tax=Agrobacterium tumefaciens TaxID=358 RepID=UPI003BA28B43